MLYSTGNHNFTLMTRDITDSNDTIPNRTWGISALGNWEDVVVGSYIGFIVFASIGMNLLILCVMYKNRSRLMYTDYFIVSLAVTDLGSPVFAYPMACTSSFYHRWLYGRAGCQVNGFLGFYFGICGMETLAVMSFIRYLKICHRQYSGKLNNCVTYYIIVMIYLVCALIAGCPFLSWGQYDLEIFGTSCSIVWHTRDLSYIAFIMITCLAIPFLVMSASYIGIVRETRCYATHARGRSHWSKNEIRLVKTTLFMCIAFVSAWTPYSVVSMLNVFYGRAVVTQQISIVPHLVAKSSHLLNPVVYFFMNQKYQKYVLGIFRICYNCKREVTEETRITSAGIVSADRKTGQSISDGVQIDMEDLKGEHLGEMEHDPMICKQKDTLSEVLKDDIDAEEVYEADEVEEEDDEKYRL